MRTAIPAALAAFIATATPALAVEVAECGEDGAASAPAIAEPWEKNARAFYNGNVRVAVTDTGGEPVCCSMHLLILVPAQTQDGMDAYRNCYLVNDHEGMGFVGIDFAKLATSYDAAKGLLITFPYQLYNDGNPGKGGIARVRVNVQKGTAAVE